MYVFFFRFVFFRVVSFAGDLVTRMVEHIKNNRKKQRKKSDKGAKQKRKKTTTYIYIYMYIGFCFCFFSKSGFDEVIIFLTWFGF